MFYFTQELPNVYTPPTFMENLSGLMKDLSRVINDHRTEREILEVAFFIWDTDRHGKRTHSRLLKPGMTIGPKHQITRGPIRIRTISPCGLGKVRIYDDNLLTYEASEIVQMRSWRRLIDKTYKTLIGLRSLWAVPVRLLTRCSRLLRRQDVYLEVTD